MKPDDEIHKGLKFRLASKRRKNSQKNSKTGLVRLGRILGVHFRASLWPILKRQVHQGRLKRLDSNLIAAHPAPPLVRAIPPIPFD